MNKSISIVHSDISACGKTTVAKSIYSSVYDDGMFCFYGEGRISNRYLINSVNDSISMVIECATSDLDKLNPVIDHAKDSGYSVYKYECSRD